MSRHCRSKEGDFYHVYYDNQTLPELFTFTIVLIMFMGNGWHELRPAWQTSLVMDPEHIHTWHKLGKCSWILSGDNLITLLQGRHGKKVSLIIDREALSKQGDNRFGSVCGHPFICSSVCVFVCAFLAQPFDLHFWHRGRPWPRICWDCRSKVKVQCRKLYFDTTVTLLQGQGQRSGQCDTG